MARRPAPEATFETDGNRVIEPSPNDRLYRQFARATAYNTYKATPRTLRVASAPPARGEGVGAPVRKVAPA
jgi:hypothetical protein